MVNKETLERALTEALQGKQMDKWGYRVNSQIEMIIKDVFAKNELQLEARVFIHRSDYRSKYYDLWFACPRTNDKSFCLCVIEVTKSKDWRDNYYYKSFRVCQDFNIDDSINKYLDSVKRDNEKTQNVINQALALYRHIKNLYPSASEEELYDRIKYLGENVWYIQKLDKGAIDNDNAI